MYMRDFIILYWSKIGGKGFISLAKWPEFDEAKINEKFDKK